MIFLSFADVKEISYLQTNNLEAVTATSRKYADCFGFTEEEVFAALDESGLSESRQEVKSWYDGFTFGNRTDIYNPWSVLNFPSSNSLAGRLIQRGSKDKADFERLLQGDVITAEIDEQIVYSQFDDDERAVWSLLLAGGYLKVRKFRAYMSDFGEWKEEYQLELTNFEVKVIFQNIIRKWFTGASCGYNDFIKALLADDVRAVNAYMNKVAMRTFSCFDTGKNRLRKSRRGFIMDLY